MPVQDSPSDQMSMEVDALDGGMVSERPAPSRIPSPELLHQPPALSKPPGYHWRATIDLEPGMVVARPVVGSTGSRVTMHLAIGSLITTDTIAQLMNKGVECVAVADNQPCDLEIYAETVRRFETRLHEIFEPEPDESCRLLLDALVKNGPCKC